VDLKLIDRTLLFIKEVKAKISAKDHTLDADLVETAVQAYWASFSRAYSQQEGMPALRESHAAKFGEAGRRPIRKGKIISLYPHQLSPSTYYELVGPKAHMLTSRLTATWSRRIRPARSAAVARAHCSSRRLRITSRSSPCGERPMRVISIRKSGLSFRRPSTRQPSVWSAGWRTIRPGGQTRSVRLQIPMSHTERILCFQLRLGFWTLFEYLRSLSGKAIQARTPIFHSRAACHPPSSPGDRQGSRDGRRQIALGVPRDGPSGHPCRPGELLLRGPAV
jgi:hypothetical protein